MKKLLLTLACLSGVACYAEEVVLDLQRVVLEPREIYIDADKGFVLYTDNKTYVFKEIRYENGKFVAVY